MLSGEEANTNFQEIGLTRPGIETTTFNTRSEHDKHFTSEAFRSGVYKVHEKHELNHVFEFE